MAALPPAVLAHDHPRSLAEVLGGALPSSPPGDVLDHLGQCLSDDFDIKHSTFQLETPEHVLWEARTAQPQH